jgi:hypothetical protein
MESRGQATCIQAPISGNKRNLSGKISDNKTTTPSLDSLVKRSWKRNYHDFNNTINTA